MLLFNSQTIYREEAMMKMYSLDTAIRQSSQEEIAASLGVTQGAIWQALKSNRNIYILEDANQHQAVEIKGAFKTKPKLDLLIAALESANDPSNHPQTA